jgi:hypothetical protein
MGQERRYYSQGLQKVLFPGLERPQVKFDLCGDCSGEEYQIWTRAATSPGLNLLFEEV